MLVLNRAKGQEILIGSEIRIVVVELDNSHVRIGIEAPVEIPILRPDAQNKKPLPGSKRWEP